MQALDTMKKLRDTKGYVKLTLDKLPRIRAGLVKLDDECQEWDILKLVESLWKWNDHNPKITHNSKKNEKYKCQMYIK